MKQRLIIFGWLLWLAPAMVLAQKTDSLTKKLDSLGKKADSVGGNQKNVVAPAAYNETTKITPKVYAILVYDDIKQQVTVPFRLSGKDWLKVGAFGAGIGAIMLFADHPINKFAVDYCNHNPKVVSVSSYVTQFGGTYEGYTLAALGAYGLIFKREKEKTTTLLATQAYITAASIETIIKYLTARQRPSYYDPTSKLNANSFHGPLYNFQHSSASFVSFPSGHTTVIFAAATVFAMEYRSQRIVPIIAYSAATLVGLSRITENQHWASDVIVGAALGFLCGRQVVNNYHRYAKIQNEKAKKKATLSFNLNYDYHTLMPGLIYTFHR
jgi:membrane-associated phospholipid phosphatase